MIRRRAALLLLAACGAPTVCAGAQTPAIVVSDAWSRPAVDSAVVYATLRNTTNVADRLVGASSPIAKHVGLHQSSQTSATGTPMPMSMSMGNMPMPMSGSLMTMKTLSSIPVPAHGTTLLAPGGYHLMLDLRHDLAAGATLPLRLRFARAGWVETTVKVRPIR